MYFKYIKKQKKQKILKRKQNLKRQKDEEEKGKLLSDINKKNIQSKEELYYISKEFMRNSESNDKILIGKKK